MDSHTEALILSLVLIVGGIYVAVRNLRLLQNEDMLRAYMQTSPKAWIWVKKYGLDGATKLTRQRFIPTGLVASGVMVGFGAWVLWRLYG